MKLWYNTFPRYFQRNLYNSLSSSLLIAGKLWSQGSITKGRQLELFRNLLQEHYQCTVFLTGSGRVAITLFLQALDGRTTNKNVLLPFYICPSVPDAVINAGFKPVFLPIRRDLTMDPSAITLQGAREAVAIIIPHIYGYPAATEEIISRVKFFNSEIAILDDAAAAFNVSAQGRPLGSFGDAGVLSF
jgi:dTDP-4-amino-4,6-dideoxygalactose transaminase